MTVESLYHIGAHFFVSEFMEDGKACYRDHHDSIKEDNKWEKEIQFVNHKMLILGLFLPFGKNNKSV